MGRPDGFHERRLAPILADMNAGTDKDLDAVIATARALLTDEVRADPARWGAFVHPDYFQFGFGGSEVRFGDLHSHLGPLEGSIDMDIYSCERLADDVILLLWKGRSERGVVNRGSVYVRTPDGWKLRYQQGTRV